MTREEAIKRLKEYEQYAYGIWHNDEEDTQAFSMAIESLQADTVSREDTVTLNSPIIIQAEMVAVVRCKDGERKGGDDE